MSARVVVCRQRGVITLLMALVLLLLSTLLVTTDFRLSTTSLRAVGNVQSHMEAIAAAEKVIAQIIAEDAGLPAFQTARTVPVDIDRDRINDYLVRVPAPVCVRATRAGDATASSVTLPGFVVGGAWNTLWEITAVATAVAGDTRVRVVQGIRYLLNEGEKNAVCD